MNIQIVTAFKAISGVWWCLTWECLTLPSIFRQESLLSSEALMNSLRTSWCLHVVLTGSEPALSKPTIYRIHFPVIFGIIPLPARYASAAKHQTQPTGVYTRSTVSSTEIFRKSTKLPCYGNLNLWHDVIVWPYLTVNYMWYKSFIYHFSKGWCQPKSSHVGLPHYVTFWEL